MEKILFITNISGEKIGSFSIAAIQAAHKCNLEFHMASNFNASTDEQMKIDEKNHNIKLHHIDIVRNPMNLKNIVAYKQIVDLIKKENIDIIHCNTPVGGALGRLAGKKCGIKKVIYQAHGFHFYKGAPKLNWLIYYPIERFLAHLTDNLITINKEDYEIAQKFNLRNTGKVYYVPGVGIDINEFQDVDVDIRKLRSEFGCLDNDIVAISAGRLDKNKNNETLIRAISLLENQKIKLVICGDGVEKQNLIDLAEKLNLEDRVKFLGNRSDMKELYKAADIFVMASFREGLSRSIMESMASGLPCIVTNIRGNCDLVEDGKGGFLVKPIAKAFAEKIKVLEKNKVRINMGNYNQDIINEFSLENVVSRIVNIYSSLEIN